MSKRRIEIDDKFSKKSRSRDQDETDKKSDEYKTTATPAPSATIKPGLTLNPLTGIPYSQKYYEIYRNNWPSSLGVS